MQMLSVAPRFCGPPGTANGGYLAGLLAQHAPTTVCVRLNRPAPLAAALQIVHGDGGHFSLYHEGQCIAAVKPATLDLPVPVAPDYLAAMAASRRFVGFEAHPFPRCFVCGPARVRGDGLRIFPGACPEGGLDLVAAPWVPDLALGQADGKVSPEFMWAALDCPGYFAARADRVPMLLGEFTAHVDRRVHVDEPCVVIGWRLALSGRKHEVGTALFTEEGELCARARATWIEVRGHPGPAAQS